MKITKEKKRKSIYIVVKYWAITQTIHLWKSLQFLMIIYRINQIYRETKIRESGGKYNQ